MRGLFGQEEPSLLQAPRNPVVRYRRSTFIAASALALALASAAFLLPGLFKAPPRGYERRPDGGDSSARPGIPEMTYDGLSFGRTAPDPTARPPDFPPKPLLNQGAPSFVDSGDLERRRRLFFVDEASASQTGSAGSRDADGVVSRAADPSGASRTYVLAAGDVISGALVTALDSDLPGAVVAQVTRPVYDHASGRAVLIPQGARLIGTYDARPYHGQVRAQLLWSRIVMPNGGSVDLGSTAGSDLTGASGLKDRVDDHLGPIMRAIALTTALAVGGAASQNASARSTGGFVINDAAAGASARASEVGDRWVDRDLNRQPTLKVRSGWPLTVIVARDLRLAAYTEPTEP